MDVILRGDYLHGARLLIDHQMHGTLQNPLRDVKSSDHTFAIYAQGVVAGCMEGRDRNVNFIVNIDIADVAPVDGETRHWTAVARS